MPDLLNLPDWFGPVVATAVITVVAGRVVAAVPKGWFRSGLRRVNHWRKFVIGTKQTRASVISQWRKAPPRLLRSTLFGWFETNPQVWWSYVHRVYQSHDSAVVRESARGLLWVDKPVTDVRVGDIDQRGGHVLGLSRQGDATRIDHGARHSTTFYSGTTMVSLNRGWCPRDWDCPDCFPRRTGLM